MDMEDINYRKITVAEMAPHVHSFSLGESKVDKLFNWIKSWIILSLDCGKIKPYDLLPSKADLAYHLGVSQGTIQNTYRRLEDKGLVESKQRIGTYIKGNNQTSVLTKLTSKRECAIEVVKKYLDEMGYKKGDIFISIRQLAKITGIPNTTLRVAVASLVQDGILDKHNNTFTIASMDFSINKIEGMTLVDKIAEDLREYILKNFKGGERLPVNEELVRIFKVSSKTIHDAIRRLSKEGLLYCRRGQYGTIVQNTLDTHNVELYCYEKVEQKLRKYISDNCQVGDKLPAIKNFAKKYSTSEKTIKRALDNLAEEGFITFARGRYGGTFVLDIPAISGMGYKWLAISNDYIVDIGNS